MPSPPCIIAPMVAAATDNDSQIPGSPSTPAESRRILFYSHDGTGLGHLRITLGVATAYAEVRPQDSLLLLTGSLQAGAFDLPASLDYVKLPAMPKRDLYASLPPTEGFTGSHNSTIRFRAALALATVQAFDPHLVVVDHAPGGLFQELAPALEHLRWSSRRPRFVLLMRDITFGPEQTRSIWTNEGVYPLLDDLYDQILIYGDRRVFDPIQAYAMSEATAERTSFCGYLAPQGPKRSSEAVRQELGAGSFPLVVVSVGGGADGGPVLRAYIEGLRERIGPPLYSYIVAGPLLPETDLAELSTQCSCLPNVRFVPFDPDFSAAVQAADVVVSMGGYNSIVEAVYFGKRPVVVPRQPGPEEQVLRAEGFDHLGLATVVKPEMLAPDALWAAINETLSDGARPTQSLPFDGLTRIAAALAATASN